MKGTVTFMTTVPEKRKRMKRNFEREITELKLYAHVSVQVIESIMPDLADGGPESQFMKGQCAALRAVLQRIDGDK